MRLDPATSTTYAFGAIAVVAAAAAVCLNWLFSPKRRFGGDPVAIAPRTHVVGSHATRTFPTIGSDKEVRR